MMLLARHFDGERRQPAGRDRAGHDESEGGKNRMGTWFTSRVAKL
jgi:hypothetical protein